MIYLHNGIMHSNKNDKLQLHKHEWISQTILSKRSQAQKNTFCVILLIYHPKSQNSPMVLEVPDCGYLEEVGGSDWREHKKVNFPLIWAAVIRCAYFKRILPTAHFGLCIFLNAEVYFKSNIHVHFRRFFKKWNILHSLESFFFFN